MKMTPNFRFRNVFKNWQFNQRIDAGRHIDYREPGCDQIIEDPDVIKKSLKHLGLWDVKRKPWPVANAPPIDVFPAYDEQPGPSSDDYIRDPEYPAEAYF